MRVFIAIPFDLETTAAIDNYLKPLKKRATPIKWVREENIHLTLKFIGDVEQSKLTEIRSVLSKIQHPPFQLKLRGGGSFNTRGILSILWIGVDGDPETALEQLVSQIETELSSTGIEKEKRPFKAHVTVGRNKRKFNYKFVEHFIQERNSRLIHELRVKHFCLIKSQLTPSGPIYRIIDEYQLNQLDKDPL